MPIPANGITPEVIRDILPPYHLSPDLLAATFAILAPPPPDATTAWRRARITRLLEEIAGLKPADAAQARIATQILITSALGDSITARAAAPDLPLAELCRIARATAELQRAANGLERTLARHQQKPVPFFGTVVQDEVDIPALDALWGRGTPAVAASGATQPPATQEPAPSPPRPRARVPGADKVAPPPGAAPAPAAAPPPAPANAAPPAAPPSPPDAAPPAAEAAPPPVAAPARPAADPPPQPPTRRDRAPAAATPADGTAPAWTLSRLDEVPGWTCDVLRPRAADAAPKPAPAR